MKIRDYEKWLDEDYVPSERSSKKIGLKKMKKFEQATLTSEPFTDKKKLKK
jgi:hypothetical protein